MFAEEATPAEQPAPIEYEVSRAPQAEPAAAAPAAEVAAQPEGAAAAPAATPAQPEAGAAPAAQPAATPEAQAQPAPAGEYDWIKENELAQKALEAVKNGDIANFAKNFSVDYDAMSNEDLIRHKIEKENPGAPANVINSLYAKEMSKYDLGSFDDEKKEAGTYLLQQAATSIRDGLKESQKAYQIPQQANQPQVTEAEQARQEELITLFTTHPALLAFETNPTLELGSGDDKLNFSAPATLTKDAVLNTDLMTQLLTTDAAGKPVWDMPKFLRLVNYAANPEAVETALINHGKTLGAKADFLARHNPGERPAGQAVGPQGEQWEITRSRS